MFKGCGANVLRGIAGAVVLACFDLLSDSYVDLRDRWMNGANDDDEGGGGGRGGGRGGGGEREEVTIDGGKETNDDSVEMDSVDTGSGKRSVGVQADRRRGK